MFKIAVIRTVNHPRHMNETSKGDGDNVSVPDNAAVHPVIVKVRKNTCHQSKIMSSSLQHRLDPLNYFLVLYKLTFECQSLQQVTII